MFQFQHSEMSQSVTSHCLITVSYEITQNDMFGVKDFHIGRKPMFQNVYETERIKRGKT